MEPSACIADFEELISFEDNSDREDYESYSCLNIEVLEHSSLPKEIEDATMKKSYSCTLCSFSSQRESHFIKHTALHSSGQQIHHCNHCNFSSLRLTHLRRHEATHSDQIFKCSASSSCNYSTDESKLLARHKRLKHKVLSSICLFTTCIEQLFLVNPCILSVFSLLCSVLSNMTVAYVNVQRALTLHRRNTCTSDIYVCIRPMGTRFKIFSTAIK